MMKIFSLLLLLSLIYRAVSCSSHLLSGSDDEDELLHEPLMFKYQKIIQVQRKQIEHLSYELQRYQIEKSILSDDLLNHIKVIEELRGTISNMIESVEERTFVRMEDCDEPFYQVAFPQLQNFDGLLVKLGSDLGDGQDIAMTLNHSLLATSVRSSDSHDYSKLWISMDPSFVPLPSILNLSITQEAFDRFRNSLLSFIRYIHSRDIVHSSISEEYVLYSSDGTFKLLPGCFRRMNPRHTLFKAKDIRDAQELLIELEKKISNPSKPRKRVSAQSHARENL